jgi:hypothetical protein
MDQNQRATLPSTHDHLKRTTERRRVPRPRRIGAIALAGLALMGIGAASATSASAAADYPPGPSAVDLPPGPGLA